MYKKGGISKQYPISAWVPIKPGPYVKVRQMVPFPDTKLDDLLPFVIDVEKRRLHDNEYDSIEIVKELPMGTKLVYVVMKQQCCIACMKKEVITQSVRHTT